MSKRLHTTGGLGRRILTFLLLGRGLDGGHGALTEITGEG